MRPAAVAFTLALTSACTLKEPIMVLPPALLSSAEVYPVSGRTGILILNPPVAFGPFHTIAVRRGWRNDSSWSWWAIDEEERWDASQASSFVLEGPRRQRWDARCLSRAHRHHRDQAVGVHLGPDGLGIDRRTVESASEAVFLCAFQQGGHSRAQMRLSDADPSGFGGVLIDDDHAVLARITSVREQTGRPYTYTVPQPVGFLVDGGGDAAVAVERAFQGKVVMARAVSPARAMMLAAVATALLIWEPLTN